MIEATGAGLRYLPPYSPDFNPIEIAFAKLKALLRKAADRTVNGLWAAIGRIIDLFPPAECTNDFSAGGYDATRSDSALANLVPLPGPVEGVMRQMPPGREAPSARRCRDRPLYPPSDARR
jgi:hypothetical protein